jgi:diguanylate cyclase (GGDEF)-like protein/PAS domain S-box-containing protein
VVAARSLPEQTGLSGAERRPTAALHDGAGDVGPDPAEAVTHLAARWAAGTPLAPSDRPAAAELCERLVMLLHRLGAVCRDEPFWPLRARALGAELLGSGVCGDPSGPLCAAEDALSATLVLLREHAPAALGLSPLHRRRLTTALDELAAGFAGALRDRVRREQEDRLRSDRRIREGVERALALSETHYRAVYSQGPVGIAVTALDGRILDLNPALRRMLGLPDGPLPMALDLLHPDDRAGTVDRFRRLGRGIVDVVRTDLRFVRPDGSVLRTNVASSLVRDDAGRPTHVIAVVEDRSERFRLRSRLAQVAAQDALTLLPNRSVTEQWLQRAFASPHATCIGLCALDLDGFTAVNDGLGHGIGDRLLLAVAGRLQLAAAPHLVTRTGGDEFAVLVDGPADVAEVGRLAHRVREALAAPFRVGHHTLTVSASIGVAAATATGSSPAELMRAADVALSWAKAQGPGRVVVFDPDRDAGEAARAALMAGLRTGVERGEFRLHYQPLVRLSDRRVRGMEALLRWEHPEHGLLGPTRFVELAERTGAIVPLGHWVLETACAQAAAWRRQLGPEAPYVSVNVSPVQLVEPGWVAEVTRVIHLTELPVDMLQLEITEQAVLRDETAALESLAELRAAGVRIALDDFGTGYSGLAWLRRLPVHALKIDGSFAEGLRHAEADPVDSSIVDAMVRMAHALNLEVTAEWVETGLQVERLAAFGCDLGQGRWFGEAAPAEAVPAIWRRSIG